MRTLRPPFLSLLLVGCAGPEEGTTPSPTGSDTGSTPTDFEGFVPFAFGLDRATFAVDASGRAVPYLLRGELVPVTVSVILADDSILQAPPSPETSCRLTWTSAEPLSPSEDASRVGAVATWILPETDPTVDDCDRFPFPPAWEGGPASVLARWRWGFGLGELPEEVASQLGDWFAEDADDWSVFVAGGGYLWDGLEGLPAAQLPQERWSNGWVDTSLTYAYEVEEVQGELSVRLVDDLPLTLPAAELWPDGRPVVARYDLQATTLLTPGSLLLRD